MIEQKKSETVLRMLQKKHDFCRRQRERCETRRLQSFVHSGEVRKRLDLQHSISSESCRSSMVDEDAQMILEPP